MAATDGRGMDDRKDRLDDRIEDRIDRFSISALGYDRDSDDIKPSFLLAYIRDKREREERRITRLGMLVTAIMTAILGAVAWPLCQIAAKFFGH